MSEMIFDQYWSGIDAVNVSKRKDPVYGPVTVFHDVVIARENVQLYEIDGKNLMAYKSADELERYWPWVEGRWAIAGRHPSTPVIVSPDDISGRTVNTRFVKNLMDHGKTERPNIRGILVDLEVFNNRVPPDILKGMLDGSLSDVSIGFLYGKEMTPGNWNGSDYDFRQVNMFHDHTAYGIRKGRCSYPACGIGADQYYNLEKSLNEKGEQIEVKNMSQVGHDPEETEENIRIPNHGAGECKVTATIVISEDQGIKALYCGETEKIRTYLFSKEKDWTMEKAQTWVDEHKEDAGDVFLARLIEIDTLQKAVDQEGARTEDERACAHFDITAEVWETLSAKAKAALKAALPERGEGGAGEDAMTEEELKTKIAEIQAKIDELYKEIPEQETAEHAEYEILYAELQAYTEALAALIKSKVIPEEGVGKGGEDEVERSKRLLKDPRLKRDPI